MTEDKLTHDERLRLECLAQSVAVHAMKSVTAETIVEYALRFESYVSGRLMRAWGDDTYLTARPAPSFTDGAGTTIKLKGNRDDRNQPTNGTTPHEGTRLQH